MLNDPKQATLIDAIRQAHMYYEAGQWEDCRDLCQQIQQQSPNRPRILHLQALLENNNGRHQQALGLIEAALDRRGDILEFHNTQGLIYMALGSPADAYESFSRAYELLPDKTEHPELAKIYGNIANSLNVQGKFTEAIEFHNHALSINPEDPYALWNRAHIYLLHGQFEQGWEGYESRFQVRSKSKQSSEIRHDIPKWDGADLHGKRLLVHDEQGYGDVLQFSRYLPKLAEFGGEVVFETRWPLADLLKDVPGVDRLCLKRDAIYKQIDFDYHIYLCSLPGIFSTTLDSIPNNSEYLFIDPEKIAYWIDKIPLGEFRVGLVWTGNLGNIMLRYRSCPLALLEPLLDVAGVTFVGLQKGEKLGDISDLPSSLQFANLGDEFDDFSDTAAVIEQLDLVITIDTAVAHLAGAMSKQVWLLLSYLPDFRWLLEREDSPWYPSMRIFRQTEYGNWQPVIENITAALKNHCHSVIDNQ